jgi:hypothetical protein
MWRFASLGLAMLLAGCGYATWANAPFTAGSNPHAPVGSSENLRRAMGENAEVPALTPEPGNIWPGPLPPMPSLGDLERQGNLQSLPEQPVPGSPLNRGTAPGQLSGPLAPSLPPQVSHGSSTPPSSNQPGLATIPIPSPSSPRTQATPPARGPAGQTVPTREGPGVTTGGGQGYQTMTLPGGGTAIVVPNGNGTSTVIKPDGTIETVPTPR